MIYFGKGFRSLHTGNVGSVGERATKLLAVKFGGLTEESTASAITAEVCSSASAWAWLCPGSNNFQSLMDGNFVGLWPTDPTFCLWKDLNPLYVYDKSSRGWQHF